MRLLPILMAVKSCRGRAIDWHRAASGTRKVVCALLLTINGAAASTRNKRGKEYAEEAEADYAKSLAFHVGTKGTVCDDGEFNGEGGQTKEKLDELQHKQQQLESGGMGFNAKTTYLGKVSCFVSVTLLLLYSSWCCYLLTRSSSSSSRSIRIGDRISNSCQCSDSFIVSPAHNQTYKGGKPLQNLLLWNAMNFGYIVQDCHKELGGHRVGERSLRSNAKIGHVALLVTSLILVSVTVMLIPFCYRLHRSKQIMRIKWRTNLCMEIGQDFIRDKIKLHSRSRAVVSGGCLTLNLQVLHRVDRFCRRTMRANGED